MINTKDIYEVFAALVPLYVALLLGSGSVQFWKIFTPEQCSGINRFVAVFAVPLLSFHFISSNDPYTMNFRFIDADSLQKVVILSILFLWQAIDKRRGGNGSFEWMITLFSLSTLPNTLVMGIPLMNAMYGDFTETLMIQIVVLQSVIWYTVMIFMFEYRAAKVLISKQFPETAEAISSFRVDSNIFSLSDCEPLQVSSEIDNDGKLHVLLRRSSSSVSSTSVLSLFNKSHGVNSITSLSPRASNLSGVEILSAQSASRTSNKELHMFVWSPSPCSTSDGDHLENTVITNNNGFADSTEDFEVTDDKVAPQLETTVSRVMERKGTKKHQMPPAGVTSRLILVMVWRKLIRNPNTYASVLGLVWSLISFRWNVKMPSIVKGSIEIVSGAGLGMTMFSLGLFMGMQPKIIACGKCLAMVGMAVRFLIGPAVVAATSVAIGIRGNLLHVAIIQAALPQAIVPFVFAKEYNVHADILSTVVLFGMIIALPVAIIYYVLLGL